MSFLAGRYNNPPDIDSIRVLPPPPPEMALNCHKWHSINLKFSKRPSGLVYLPISIQLCAQISCLLAVLMDGYLLVPAIRFDDIAVICQDLVEECVYERRYSGHTCVYQINFHSYSTHMLLLATDANLTRICNYLFAHPAHQSRGGWMDDGD